MNGSQLCDMKAVWHILIGQAYRNVLYYLLKLEMNDNICGSLLRKVTWRWNVDNRIRRFRRVIFLLSIVIFILCACSNSQEVETGMGDNNGQVNLKIGQILAVELDSNPTTGYGWEIASMDTTVLEMMGESEYTRSDTGETPRVGSGGTETFRFKAIGQGQSPLEMVYRRPWEAGVEPANSFSLTVTVTGK